MLARARIYLDSIRFEHTVFALPFAYMGMLLAAGGWPGWDKLCLISLAMVGARTGAMAVNRLVDAESDARNPRTSSRALPVGAMGRSEMAVLAVAGFAVLLMAARLLNSTAFALAPVAALIVTFYSYTKRFTWASHWMLGFADAIAAAGAWIGVRGDFGVTPLLLAMAMMFWIAGFDLIYACQDVGFDRSEGLHSVPARFGEPAALLLSRLSHLVSIGALLGLGIVAGLGWPFWLGVLAAAALLVHEATLVKPGDLGNVQKAFFDMNGYVAIVLLGAVGFSYLIA